MLPSIIINNDDGNNNDNNNEDEECVEKEQCSLAKYATQCKESLVKAEVMNSTWKSTLSM